MMCAGSCGGCRERENPWLRKAHVALPQSYCTLLNASSLCIKVIRIAIDDGNSNVAELCRSPLWPWL